MSVEKACEYCGEVFVDRSHRQHGKFCSRGCYNRVYYQVNREKASMAARVYYEANREKLTAYRRAYYEANPEKAREAVRAHRAANPEKVAAYHRTFREANPEKMAARDRAWQKANPEKVRERNARQRARKLDAYVAPVDHKAIYKRDDYTCQLCGKKVEMGKEFPHPMSPSIDHILPLSKGGTHEPDNCQLAHLRCNTKKGNRVIL